MSIMTREKGSFKIDMFAMTVLHRHQTEGCRKNLINFNLPTKTSPWQKQMLALQQITSKFCCLFNHQSTLLSSQQGDD